MKNEEKKKVLTPVEVVTEAMDNPFIANIDKIDAIARRENVDVGVGLDMYLTETYGNSKEGRAKINLEELKVYKALVRKYRFDNLMNLVKEAKAENK